jgi:hypothetical protein
MRTRCSSGQGFIAARAPQAAEAGTASTDSPTLFRAGGEFRIVGVASDRFLAATQATIAPLAGTHRMSVELLEAP